MFDPTTQNFPIHLQAAAAGVRPWNPATAPLPEPEKQDLLSQVSNAGLGALHTVGSTLDKAFGGRAVRGLLGGKPGEALSIIPFSDTLGITDERNRVSGEDLAKEWGLLSGEGAKGQFEARDLVGPAVEAALDPATYLTLGTSRSLTAAGKAAEKAGTLAPTMAGRIGAGQAGLASWMGNPILTGSAGQKAAEKLGQFGDYLLYSRPGRVASRLFDPNVAGLATEAGQRSMRAVQPQLRAGEVEARQAFLDVGKKLEAGGALEQPDLFRQTLEHGFPGPVTNAPEMLDAAHSLRGYLDQMRGRSQDLGRPVPEMIDEFIDYAPRQRTRLERATKGYAGQQKDFPVNTPNQLAREELLKDIPGGTQAINALVKDQALANLRSAPNPLQAQQHIRHTYLGGSAADDALRHQLTQAAQAGTITAAEADTLRRLNAVHKKAEGLAEWVQGLDPQYAAGGKDFFGNHPLTDFAVSALRNNRANAHAGALHDMLAQNAILGGAVTPDTVPVLEALEKAGLSFNGIHNGTGQAFGAGQTLFDRLRAAGHNLASPADLQGVRVPRALAEDAARYSRAFEFPEALQPVLGAWDTLTNLNKAAVTSLWPAFHSRNAITGLWQNYVIGAHYPGGNYHQPFLDANALRSGQVIAGANQFPGLGHLTDAEATRVLAEEMFAHGARVPSTATAAGEAVGLGTHLEPGVLKLPGTAAAAEPRVGEALAGYGKGFNPVGNDYNPLHIRGVAGNAETTFGPVKGGQALGAAVDDVNRVSAYLALRKQGFAPAVAAERSKLAHFDYSRLTGFEREVMRRVFPFYNWTRQNLPFQLEQLALNPGGKTGQAVRAADSLRADAGFVPDYVSNGMAIPVGQEDSGQQRFLTHFGLPFEDAFSLLGTGASPVQKTVLNALGQSNPLIKGPLELATGKQFYSGRTLADLYPITGSTAVDQLIMNSPAARVYTTGRTLLDERKDLADKVLQVTGPGRIMDVDMDKARSIEARKYLTDVLEDNPAVKSFQELYVTPDQAANLSPAELNLMRLYKALDLERKKAGRQKPAAIGVMP